MAKINNSGVIQKLVDELDLSPAKDVIPTELAEKILPVFQINSEEIIVKKPTANIIMHETMTDSSADTAKTIYTTPASGKFYLTGFTTQMSNTSSTGANDVWISIFIDSVEKELGFFRLGETATYSTSEEGFLTHDFTNPILIDAGSIIALKRTTADKNVIRGTIMGYTESD